MATIDVLDANSEVQTLEAPLAPGRALAATSRPVVLSSEDYTALVNLLTEMQAVVTALGGTLNVDGAVSGTVVVSADPPSYSGGVTTSTGAAQTMVAANASRRLLVIQNTSDTDFWVNEIGTAAVGVGLLLAPGKVLAWEDFSAPQTAISVFCGTAGKTLNWRQA